MAKGARVRFYFDADVLGLAHVLCRLRNDATYPGDEGAELHRRVRPPCPITSPAVKDTDWIPVVAAEGWLIITRDSQIQNNLAELSAVREHKARMVALSGKDAAGTWNQLEIFMRQWAHIEPLCDEPGPFIYRASRTRLIPLTLEPLTARPTAVAHTERGSEETALRSPPT